MLNFVCQDSYTLDDFVRLIRFLRSEDGCPWDRVQTHQSIRRNFLEEAYEACEAIDEGDLPHMREELGDVLMQVLFHADIEREAGHFTIQDVADAACKKLVSRHPHVFGDVAAADADWETVKRRERAQTTTAQALRAVSRYLPGLWRGDKLLAKAQSAGAAAPALERALPERAQALGAALRTGDAARTEQALGALLLAAAAAARQAGVDPETAIHRACDGYIDRFAAAEAAGEPLPAL